MLLNPANIYIIYIKEYNLLHFTEHYTLVEGLSVEWANLAKSGFQTLALFRRRPHSDVRANPIKYGFDHVIKAK